MINLNSLPDHCTSEALELFLAEAKIGEFRPALYFHWNADSVQRLIDGLRQNPLLDLSSLLFYLSLHEKDLTVSSFCQGVVAWLSKSALHRFDNFLLTSTNLQQVVEIKKKLESLETLDILQEAAQLYLPRTARLATVFILSDPYIDYATTLGPSSYLPSRRILFD